LTAETTQATDEYKGETLPASIIINKTLMKELVKVNPWLSSFHIALEWSAIIAAAVLCWYYWHPLLYVVTVAFIGARQHALVIMMHDGSHYRLYRNRELNDWVSQLFLAWPFLIADMLSYRNTHHAHHRFTNRQGDPDWKRKQTADWVYPRSHWAVVKILLTYLFGGFFITAAALRVKPDKSAEKPTLDQKQRSMKLVRGILMLLLLASFFVADIAWFYGFLLFWLVPFFTWCQVCLIIRSIAEHFAVTQNRQGVFGLTRTVTPPVLEQMFIASKGVYYHFEHHLFPGVPFYNLKRLHLALMEHPEYRDGIHLNSSYWQVLFSDCTGRSGPVIDIARPAAEA
jgi:fatty acid desaturase